MSEHTPTPWRACNKGKCKCGQIWSEPADHPVATGEWGQWGDSYPSLRFVAGRAGSVAPVIEPYTEFCAYGSIDEKESEGNARLIVASVNAITSAAERLGVDAVDLAERLDGGGLASIVLELKGEHDYVTHGKHPCSTCELLAKVYGEQQEAT